MNHFVDTLVWKVWFLNFWSEHLLPEPALHVYLRASFYIFCTAGHLKTHSFWATGSTNSQCHSEWDHSATLLTFCDIRLHLYPHPLGQWRLVIHRVGWELVAFVSDQVAPLHFLPPSLLLQISLFTFSFPLLSFASPTGRVPDRLRLQLRRLYALPEAGSRGVVSSEAQDNGVYHMRIWNYLILAAARIKQTASSFVKKCLICCLLKM